ncbi:MAG: transposase [Candidatus Magasanikbacteria bacterium]|nr:transposase [Candidatus Magasanikbacteria bacterium]
MLLDIMNGRYSIKEIFQNHWTDFLLSHAYVLDYVKETVDKMLACRDPGRLGYSKYRCPQHPGCFKVVPRSCKSRLCNACGKVATDRWINKTMNDLPPVEYYHLTFTVPLEIRNLMFEDKRLLSLIHQAASTTILSWLKERNQSLPVILQVLHTFGRDLKFHPHIHALVSAGGLDIETKKIWLVNNHWPRRALERRFKANLLNLLLKKKKIDFGLKHRLWKIEWYIHTALAPVLAGLTARYIGRYTRRPPLSEARIVGYNPDFGGRVSFKYEDWYENKQTKIMTLTTIQFIERITWHIPPKHLRLVQRYGLFHNRVKNKYLPILQKMFGEQTKENKPQDPQTWRERQAKLTGQDPLICPECQAEMVLTEVAYWNKRENRIKVISLP